MVQLQVILGKAGIFLALYTAHCTFQSSAQGPKNPEFPNDLESSQSCVELQEWELICFWEQGMGIPPMVLSLVLFTGVWGLHRHFLKEFNLFPIQMLIHAYLPLGKQDKCFHLQTEKAASDQKSCRCSSKTLIHLNLPDICCGKFPVTWTQHMQRFRDISQSWALPQHALPWINPGSHWSVHPPWAWKMGFLYKYLDWFEALVMAALILLAWPEASTPGKCSGRVFLAELCHEHSRILSFY